MRSGTDLFQGSAVTCARSSRARRRAIPDSVASRSGPAIVKSPALGGAISNDLERASIAESCCQHGWLSWDGSCRWFRCTSRDYSGHKEEAHRHHSSRAMTFVSMQAMGRHHALFMQSFTFTTWLARVAMFTFRARTIRAGHGMFRPLCMEQKGSGSARGVCGTAQLFPCWNIRHGDRWR